MAVSEWRMVILVVFGWGAKAAAIESDENWNIRSRSLVLWHICAPSQWNSEIRQNIDFGNNYREVSS